MNIFFYVYFNKFFQDFMKGTVGGIRVGREIARIIPVMLQPTSRPKTTAGFLWGECQIYRTWLVMVAKTENPSPMYSALPHGRECGAPTWGQTTKGRTFNAAASPPSPTLEPASDERKTNESDGGTGNQQRKNPLQQPGFGEG